jgi:hypothetical protein
MGKEGGVNDDGLDIPEFLRRRPSKDESQGSPTAGGETPPAKDTYVDPVTQRQNELRAMHEAARLEKARKRIGKLKRERGTWDPKKREWVKE